MATGKGKKRDFTQIAKSIIDRVTGSAMGDIIEQVKGKTLMKPICVGSFQGGQGKGKKAQQEAAEADSEAGRKCPMGGKVV